MLLSTARLFISACLFWNCLLGKFFFVFFFVVFYTLKERNSRSRTSWYYFPVRVRVDSSWRKQTVKNSIHEILLVVKLKILCKIEGINSAVVAIFIKLTRGFHLRNSIKIIQRLKIFFLKEPNRYLFHSTIAFSTTEPTE